MASSEKNSAWTVERERHRRVAELTDAVHGLESACHADLDDVGAEGTGVGDDVHVAGADVCGPVVVLLDRSVDFGELACRSATVAVVT